MKIFVRSVLYWKKSMKVKIAIAACIIVDILLGVWLLIRGKTIALLNPHGMIAVQEKNIITSSVAIMLVIVLPVICAIFFVVWRYREKNGVTNQQSEWHGNEK